MDPPLFTTGLLEALGYGGYRLRRVLHEARSSRPVVAYESPYARFVLVPRYSVGSAVYDAETRVPLDPADCLRLGERCRTAPHTSVYVVYLEGSHGGELLRLNVVYLAALAEHALGLSRRLLRGVVSCLEGGYAAGAEGLVGELLRVSLRVAGLVLPSPPSGVEELARRSPGLRALLGLLSSRCGSRGSG